MTTDTKIIKLISDLSGISLENISNSSNLVSDLNLTDIEKMDMLTALAKELKFEIPDDTEYESINTVQDIIEFIENNGEEL